MSTPSNKSPSEPKAEIFASRFADFILLLKNGIVYALGENASYGSFQPMPTNKVPPTTPEKVQFGENINVESIAIGSKHTFFITREGEVYVNKNVHSHSDNLQSGFGIEYKKTPQKIPFDKKVKLVIPFYHDDSCTLFITEENMAYIYDEENKEFIPFIPEKVKEVIVHLLHKIDPAHKTDTDLFITTEKDEVFALGDNNYGELGFVESCTALHKLPIEKIKHIMATAHKTLFLTKEGKVFRCGGYDISRDRKDTLANELNKLAEIPLNNKKIWKSIPFTDNTFFITKEGGVFYTRDLTLVAPNRDTVKESVVLHKIPFGNKKIIDVIPGEGTYTFFITEENEIFVRDIGIETKEAGPKTQDKFSFNGKIKLIFNFDPGFYILTEENEILVINNDLLKKLEIENKKDENVPLTIHYFRDRGIKIEQIIRLKDGVLFAAENGRFYLFGIDTLGLVGKKGEKIIEPTLIRKFMPEALESSDTPQNRSINFERFYVLNKMIDEKLLNESEKTGTFGEFFSLLNEKDPDFEKEFFSGLSNLIKIGDKESTAQKASPQEILKLVQNDAEARDKLFSSFIYYVPGLLDVNTCGKFIKSLYEVSLTFVSDLLFRAAEQKKNHEFGEIINEFLSLLGDPIALHKFLIGPNGEKLLDEAQLDEMIKGTERSIANYFSKSSQKYLQNGLKSLRDALTSCKIIQSLPPGLITPDFYIDPNINPYDKSKKGLHNLSIATSITRTFLKCLYELDNHAKKYKNSPIDDFIMNITKEVSSRFNQLDHMDSTKQLLEWIKFIAPICPETENISREIEELEKTEHFKEFEKSFSSVKSSAMEPLKKQKEAVAEFIELGGLVRETFDPPPEDWELHNI